MKPNSDLTYAVITDASGLLTITYPDGTSSPVVTGEECYKDMSKCYINKFDTINRKKLGSLVDLHNLVHSDNLVGVVHPEISHILENSVPFWTTIRPILLYKQTRIYTNKGHDKILTKLIIPAGSEVHGFHPKHIDSKNIDNRKFRSSVAYVYSQSLYESVIYESEKTLGIEKIIPETEIPIDSSVSIYNYDFKYVTGTTVRPLSKFYSMEHWFKNNKMNAFWESEIHFYNSQGYWIKNNTMNAFCEPGIHCYNSETDAKKHE